MKILLPFGTHWPMDALLRERACHERELFRSWVAGLEIQESQCQVLAELLELMDEREFVEGRAACVTYEAQLDRRTGLKDALQGVLKDLKGAGLLTSDRAADVFADDRPGVVLRGRRPDAAPTVEAVGPLWMADSWVRRRFAVRSAS
ncbi:hypothetical protein [Arthrobacter sp. BE255]|uniref:hypothetical protein n=1 Tax=Arthrobacter sp. BE255 TaxID=2817721 RepID=UPI00285B440B|nr:hypothetical protein [Arthrobacter sp. BE255]MDR7161748.1 hypothetical protein [Arthrobacter sp. BE255]